MIHNWNYPEGFNIEDYYGFVYKITNTENNKFYIGKKIFQNTRKLPPLKGQKRKRTVIKESNWKTYWGSNKVLLNLLENEPIENFKREILTLASNKKLLTYEETKALFLYSVLENPHEYFNDNILGKFFTKDFESQK